MMNPTDGQIPTLLPEAWKEAYARLYRAGRAHFPPACLHYVEGVIRQAAAASSRSAGPDDETAAGPSLAPTVVIAAFRSAVRHDFGSLRGEVLRDWGLLTPFDLGRAIGLLGSVDRLVVDADDAPAFYARDPLPLTDDPA